MRKDTLNYLVDALALVVMLGMIATGLLIKYQLPPGSRGGHGLTLWGLDRHEWGDVHFWMAVALAVLLVLHVALHWTWVIVVSLRLGRSGTENARAPAAAKRNMVGLVFLVGLAVLVGGFLWMADASVVYDEDDEEAGRGQQRAAVGALDGAESAARGGGGRGQQRGGAGDLHIRGSMTLAEVARSAGIDLALLKRELGLPADVDANERLGPLRRSHGFEMSDVRAAVAALGANAPGIDAED